MLFPDNCWALKPWPEVQWRKGRSHSGSELGLCGHVLARVTHSTHSKTWVRPIVPSVCNFHFSRRSHNWRDFSALQFNLSVDGGQEKKAWGGIAPCSQKHPVSELVVLPAPLKSAPPWKSGGFGLHVEALTGTDSSGVGGGCLPCFISLSAVVTPSNKSRFHPCLCETTHL